MKSKRHQFVNGRLSFALLLLMGLIPVVLIALVMAQVTNAGL